MPKPTQTFEEKASEMRDAAYEEEGGREKSDDEVLAEWDEALGKLYSQPRQGRSGLDTAPGNPLGDRDIPPPRSANGYRDLRVVKDAEVPYGSYTDWISGGSPGAGAQAFRMDGRANLLKPLSGLSRELAISDPSDPAYQRVQELYGPARIAYHRKNNLDINTGKPKAKK